MTTTIDGTAVEIRTRLDDARQDLEAAELDAVIADAEVTAAREALALDGTPANRSRLSRAQKLLAKKQEARWLAQAKVNALDRGLERASEAEREAIRQRWAAIESRQRQQVAADRDATAELIYSILEQLAARDQYLDEQRRENARLGTAAAADGVGWHTSAAKTLTEEGRAYTNVRSILEDLAAARRPRN